MPVGMIVWNKVTWYSQIFAIVLGVVIFVLGYYLGDMKSKSPVSETTETQTEVQTDDGEYTYTYEMPSLKLPVSYFNKNLERGSGTLNTGERYSIFDGGYQSSPTTTVSLESSEYSNDWTSLPPIKTTKDILADADIYKDHFESQITKYGEYAQRYLPDDVITSIELFDVDNDGVKETIISLCSLGENHCPHKVVVIKENRILFQTTAGATGPNIIDSGFGNGFFVTWSPWSNNGDKWDVGLCCMPGYMKTRFVYENGSFVPVYEQEVLYFRVENID